MHLCVMDISWVSWMGFLDCEQPICIPISVDGEASPECPANMCHVSIFSDRLDGALKLTPAATDTPNTIHPWITYVFRRLD